MSETPTLPVSDERTAQVLTNTETIYNSGDVDRHFARWEQGFSTHEQAERWDLNEPIVAFDPERTSIETTPYATPPEAAKTPETYEQQLEKSLHYRNTAELVAYANSITHIVVAIRRAAITNTVPTNMAPFRSPAPTNNVLPFRPRHTQTALTSQRAA